MRYPGMKILPPALLLLLAPVSLQAQVVADESWSIEMAQFFTDLPGVQPQAPLNAPSEVVCEQIVQRRAGVEPTNGERYNILNSCSRDGGPTFQSPQLPLSLEREKRGFDY